MAKKRIALLLVAVVVTLTLAVALAACDVSPSEDVLVYNRGEGEGKLKVGVISDIQLPDTPSAAGYDYERNLYRALRYFRTQGVDVLMLVGDFTDLASRYAYESFQSVWNNVFEQGLAEDERPVKAFVMGNHDYWAPYGEALSASAARERFLEYTGENPWSHKVVNGYHFISCSADSGEYHNSHESTLDWLERQLETAKVDDPDGTKPIFVETHYNPENTMYGSDEWGTEHIADVFAKYPNVVSFSGHSHYALADQRSIWQAEGGYTAIQTQSLSYTELESYTYIEGEGRTYGKEATCADAGGDAYKNGWESTIPEQWKRNPAGLMMVVDNGNVTINKVSFSEECEGEYFGQEWRIDFRKSAVERNLYTEKKVLAERAKYGAPIKRQGNLEFDGEVLSFPAFTFDSVLASAYSGAVFVHSYAVRFFDADTGAPILFDITVNENGDAKAKSEFYYYSDFYLPERLRADRVRLRLNPQIPSGAYYVVVTAIDSYGLKTANNNGISGSITVQLV